MTYYELLGVAPTASLDEIHRAYRRAVRRYHPDVNGAPNAAQITMRLNEAWATLSDSRRRAVYDRRLIPAAAPFRTAPSAWAAARPNPVYHPSYEHTVVAAPNLGLWLAGKLASAALAMLLIATFIAFVVHSLPLVATVCAVLLVARIFGSPRRSRGWGRSCGRS